MLLAKMHPEGLLPECLLEVLQQRGAASNYKEYRCNIKKGAITTLEWNIQWLMQTPPSYQGVWPRH